MERRVIPGGPVRGGEYSHYYRVGDLVFVAGTSARQSDGSIAGAITDEAGELHLDIAVQTEAVIENIARILETIGGGLANVVDVTTFLVSMDDFAEYNRVYSRLLADVGATRTTVAVSALPHPHLIIEMKVIARLSPVGSSS